MFSDPRSWVAIALDRPCASTTCPPPPRTWPCRPSPALSRIWAVILGGDCQSHWILRSHSCSLRFWVDACWLVLEFTIALSGIFGQNHWNVARVALHSVSNCRGKSLYFSSTKICNLCTPPFDMAHFVVFSKVWLVKRGRCRRGGAEDFWKKKKLVFFFGKFCNLCTPLGRGPFCSCS